MKPTETHSQSNSDSSSKDDQKWQIADVGDSKYLIIGRKTGTHIRAIGESNRNLESRHVLTGARRWQGCQVQRWLSRP